jgi:hypothetical protein
MRAAFALVALLAAGTACSQDLAIKQYSFVWTAARAGDTVLEVEKTPETTNIRLIRKSSYNMEIVQFSPQQAMEIGKALEKTQAMFEKQKGAEASTSDRIEAGGHIVRFTTSPTAGFTVNIAQRIDTGVSVSRQDAIDLTPLLLRSKEFAAFLDEKIKL